MVIPIGISFNNWAASLNVDFPTDDVPAPTPEEKWQDWADQLVACTTFSKANSPSALGYTSWQSWAQAVYNTVTSDT